MIAHRLQTSSVPEPPVGVYRIIALTFLVITLVLFAVVIFTMLKKTEIIINAKEDTKTINLLITAEKQKQNTDSLPAIVTSTKFYWSEEYYPTATRQIDSIATGKAIIYNKTSLNQPLVKTTRLLNPDGILFRLKNRITVPANGQILAEVYADQQGMTGDIGPSQFIIPGLSESKQNVIYAESKEVMTGGSGKIGIISKDNYDSAKLDFAEKTKEAFVKQYAIKIPGLDKQIIQIDFLDATSTSKIGEESTKFSIYGTSTIALVLYNNNDLAEILNKKVASIIDTNSEKILTINSNPSLSIESIDKINNSAQLRITTDATITLDANTPALEKAHFLNKQKAEIERYIVSLPHVTNMDINFTPSWINKTPGIADKLKIIVKNIK